MACVRACTWLAERRGGGRDVPSSGPCRSCRRRATDASLDFLGGLTSRGRQTCLSWAGRRSASLPAAPVADQPVRRGQPDIRAARRPWQTRTGKERRTGEEGGLDAGGRSEGATGPTSSPPFRRRPFLDAVPLTLPSHLGRPQRPLQRPTLDDPNLAADMADSKTAAVDIDEVRRALPSSCDKSPACARGSADSRRFLERPSMRADPQPFAFNPCRLPARPLPDTCVAEGRVQRPRAAPARAPYPPAPGARVRRPRSVPCLLPSRTRPSKS